MTGLSFRKMSPAAPDNRSTIGQQTFQTALRATNMALRLKSTKLMQIRPIPMNTKSRLFLSVVFCLAFLLGTSPALFADGHTFDLDGPRIDMTVKRGSNTLPISKVTDLLPGDKLWIHPEFAGDQSVRYLLIVAFLQGPTNPPPEHWFTRAETWNKQVRQEGTSITVPSGAQQVLIFLAPETGGDFGTLRSTVRGRPGVFVRAAQDLEQASLDRTRLNKYLDEITKTSNSDPSALKKNSALLAQTLRIKVNEDCFSKPVEQQPSCLVQGSDQLVLDDSHDQSMVASLTSGASSDLITNLGSSPLARGGYYSPYVGAIVDAVRLMSTLHTATYQYIPALSLPNKNELDLKLNAPPSFRNPKSVIVVGLPSIGNSPIPILHPVDPKEILCLQQSPLVLPVEGAPLMFSTAMGYDFVARIEGKSVTPVDVPAVPDAVHGGFVVDTKTLHITTLPADLTATIHGRWGYSSFEGPSFHIHSAHLDEWKLPKSDSTVLLAGHPATLHLQGECSACVEKVSLTDTAGKELKPTWKVQPPDQLEIELPLKDVFAGKLQLAVTQFGQSKPDVVPLQAYSEAAHLERFTMFSGDTHGVLTGTHLDEVASLELKDIHFTPDKQAAEGKEDSLEMVAQKDAVTSSLQPSLAAPARVTLKDGRTLNVPVTIQPPRPKVTLISKSMLEPSLPSPIRFTNHEQLPQDTRLSFFLKTDVPADFDPTEKIEVATVNGPFTTMLSLNDGSLVQQDASSVLATLDPAKAFGPAAYGPLQFRPVEADGGKGDWQPLAVLVRVPTLKEIRCPESSEKCALIGSNLFLLDSVSSDDQFKNTVTVPAGFVSDSLSVPRPYGARLYIRLRDDPATIATVALPVFPDNH